MIRPNMLWTIVFSAAGVPPVAALQMTSSVSSSAHMTSPRESASAPVTPAAAPSGRTAPSSSSAWRAFDAANDGDLAGLLQQLAQSPRMISVSPPPGGSSSGPPAFFEAGTPERTPGAVFGHHGRTGVPAVKVHDPAKAEAARQQRGKHYNSRSQQKLVQQVGDYLQAGSAPPAATLLFVDFPNIARAGPRGGTDFAFFQDVMEQVLVQFTQSRANNAAASAKHENPAAAEPPPRLFVFPVYGQRTTFNDDLEHFYTQNNSTKKRSGEQEVFSFSGQMSVLPLRYEEGPAESFATRRFVKRTPGSGQDEDLLQYDPIDATLLSVALTFAKKAAAGALPFATEVALLSHDQFRSQPFITELLSWGGKRWAFFRPFFPPSSRSVEAGS